MAKGFICFLFIFYLVLSFCVVVTNLVLSIIYYLDTRLGSELYDYPLKNWRSEVVIDFEIGINCRGDNIFHYVWPGTVTGCRCNLGGNRRGSCCIDSKKKKCSSTGPNCKGTKIPRKSSQTADIWELDDTSIQICAKRIPNYSLASQTPRSSSACSNPSDLKCGSGEYMFCVPRSHGKCPIRSMIIGDSLDSSLSQRYQEKLPITGNKTLYFSRNDNNIFPVAEFRVKQGSNVCLRNSYSIGSPGRTHYFLLDYDTAPSCYQDLRFLSTSNLGEKRLFYLNNIDDVILSLPPVYEIDDQFRYFSFYNNYGRLKPECRQYLTQIFDNTKVLASIESLALGILIISCLSISHYFFFDFWSGILQGIETAESPIPLIGNVICVSKWDQYSQSCASIYLFQCFVILKYLLIISYLVIISSSKSQIVYETNFLKDLKEKSCSDEYFNEIISQVQATVSSTYVDVIIGLLISILAFDPTLVYILRVLCDQIFYSGRKNAQVIDDYKPGSNADIKSNYNNDSDQPIMKINEKTSSIDDDIGVLGGFDEPHRGQTTETPYQNHLNEPTNSINQPNNSNNNYNVVPIVNPPVIIYPANNLPGIQHPPTVVNVFIINQNQNSGGSSLPENDPNYNRKPEIIKDQKNCRELNFQGCIKNLFISNLL